MAFAVTNTFTPGTQANANEVNTNFTEIEDEMNGYTTANILTQIMPVGSIVPWAKTITGVPALPSNWVECDGSTISDGDSPMDGEAVPDLNGDNRFLRGNSTSGGTGGDETMAHTHALTVTALSSGTGTASYQLDAATTQAASNTENRPPFYNVVWIMRIK